MGTDIYHRATQASTYRGGRCIFINNRSRKLLSENLADVAVHSHFVLSLRTFPLPCCLLFLSISSFNGQFISFLLYLMQAPFSAGHIPCTPAWGGSMHPTSSSGNSCFILVFLRYNFVQLLLLAWFFVITTVMTSDRVKQTFPQARGFLCSYSINCNGGDAGLYIYVYMYVYVYKLPQHRTTSQG